MLSLSKPPLCAAQAAAGASGEVGTQTILILVTLSASRLYTTEDKDLFVLPDDSCTPPPEGNLFKAPVVAVSPAVKWMFAITPAFRFSKNPGV